jgi:hypothetical protein
MFHDLQKEHQIKRSTLERQAKNIRLTARRSESCKRLMVDVSAYDKRNTLVEKTAELAFLAPDIKNTFRILGD